jgi:hypothetical protein
MKIQSSARSVRSLASALLFLAGGAGISLLSASASAAACRDIATVQQSADLGKNEGMGGHIAQHILGMVPPKGSSQLGKTMFSERVKYENAWKLYSRVTNPKSCSGGHVLQVFELGYPIDAFSCREADGSGKCTRWDSFHATEVALGFNKQSNGVWVLNTAYPLPQ